MTLQGYTATSLDQVIAESSSSKGAFFHRFSSKSDLALQLIERYVASDLAHPTPAWRPPRTSRTRRRGWWRSCGSTRTEPRS